jgi:hypothetical protein
MFLLEAERVLWLLSIGEIESYEGELRRIKGSEQMVI